MKYDKILRKEDKLRRKIRAVEAERDRTQEELNRMQQIFEDMMHEVRRFSEDLSAVSGQLSRELSEANLDAGLVERCETVFYMSGMIGVRLNLADIELNPGVIRQQQKVRAGLYRKFEKAKYVLANSARQKHINVRMLGSSFSEIQALTAFDFVPFVILDNAIKYSPHRQPIDIRFVDEYGASEASVQISSLGPMVEADEADKILERGYRGRNAEEIGGAGQGLGLALAKDLCALHDVALEFEPSSIVKFEMDGVKYADFHLSLTWKK